MRIFFTSFYPLCFSKHGMTAIHDHKLNKYIDGSCRREPDFENELPAITGLCRPGFVNRLNEKDLVVYNTNKDKLGKKYLVAILEVVSFENNHNDAEDYYKTNELIVPNNIICQSTSPYNLDKTHKKYPKTKTSENSLAIIKMWDKLYRNRADESSKVAICKIWENIIFLEEPPEITEDELKYIFGRAKVGTRTPPKLKEIEIKKFLEFLRQKGLIK